VRRSILLILKRIRTVGPVFHRLPGRCLFREMPLLRWESYRFDRCPHAPVWPRKIGLGVSAKLE